jgi:non-ribosomal peptide synthetase component E (peptide arylation enzyme)
VNSSALVPTHVDLELATRWRALGAWRDRSVDVSLRDIAATRPDKTAVVDGDVCLTFRQLDDAVAAVAGGMRAVGVVPGDVVTYQLPSWWESVVIAGAAFRLGAVANPILPNLRDHEVGFILDQARPRLVLTAENFRGFDHAAMFRRLGIEPTIVRPSTDTAVGFDSLLASEPCAPAETGGDDPALLLYTSGTTANAKGAIHTHNTLDALANAVMDFNMVTNDDAILVAMPMAHIGGVLYGVLLPFVAGSTAVLVEVWEGQTAVDLIALHGVTVLPGVPFYLQSALDASVDDRSKLKSLRLLALGGTRVTAEDVRRATSQLGCWSKRSYGSTELPSVTSASPASAEDDRAATTEGTPTGFAELRIVQSDGTDAPPGTVGEIWGRSPVLFQGYVDASLNSEAFEDGWFKTGDLGVVDADGWLTVTGRLKDIIIRGGENVSATEVEEILLSDAPITDIAVVAMPDPVMGERACAFVVADGAFDLDDARAVLRSRGIATFKLPERLERRDDLPRSATGKIRKDLLRAEIAALLAADES